MTTTQNDVVSSEKKEKMTDNSTTKEMEIEQITVEDEIEIPPELKGRSLRTRKDVSYNEDNSTSEDDNSDDYKEEEEDEIPRRVIRRKRTRRRSQRIISRRTRSTQAYNDYELPKHNLRRRKQITYEEPSTDEEFEVDDEMEVESAEEESSSPPPQETRVVRRTRRRRSRRTRKQVQESEEEEVASESQSEEQMNGNLDDVSENADEEQTNEVEEAENDEQNVDVDEDDDDDDDDEEEDIVEKIIACREAKIEPDEENKENKSDNKEDKEDTNSTEDDSIEYLVKYKDKSYLHVEWITASQILSQPGGKTKLARFNRLYTPESFIHLDGEYFNPEYCLVDRILDNCTLKKRKCYFVKWKGLPYVDSTWEYEESIKDKAAIQRYYRFKKIPTGLERKNLPRPPPKSFQKLDKSITFKNNNQLREYQLEGLNWLRFCWYNRRNTILADEMGLGKTVQTCTTLEYLRTEEHIRGPFLIVAPLSTITHWKREFEAWTDQNVIVYHGSQASRDMIVEYEWYYRDSRGKIIPNLYKFNTLITTYETVLTEASKLGKIKWQYLVIDEGHRLKNKNSKLLQVLKTFKTEHKLLLTGTPLQNDMGELWSLLNFLDPKQFPSSEEFLKDFGNLQDAEEVKKLHKVIEPYLLRRLKEDVEKSIPPKEEIVVEVVPTTIQKKYYRALMDRNKEFLIRGIEKKSNMPNLINVLMEARKICNHPFLVRGVEEQITKGMTEEQINETMIKCCSKLLLVDKLLTKLRQDNHKVLIFSQMVRVLNILEDYLRYRNFPYERLDGTIRGDERQDAIDRFCDPKNDSFVFLVSTRAGGVGINLTAADTVIIYDSDWNPQNDIQAQARCHRIGQNKEVKVYRLLTKNTYEKEMFERASKKLGLDRAVLCMETTEESGKTQNKLGLDSKEIDILLKYGAYSAFKQDTEDEKMLLEGDIDTILQRNSTIVRYDQPIQSEKGLSNFAKASFCFSQSDMEVDINDKDFWNKILPDSKDAEGLLRKLNSKDALKTEEDRIEFLKDVEALVEEQIQAFQRRARPPPEALSTLLIRLIYNPKFTLDKVEMVKRWLKKIEKPKRGGRDEVETEDVETTEVESETKSTKGANVKKGGWFKAERQRFQKAFLDYGWGKWKRIHAHKLSHHSLEEIHSFAESFVSQCIKYAKEDSHKEFLKSLMWSTAISESETTHSEIAKLIIEPTGTVRGVQKIKITLPEEKYLTGLSTLEIIHQVPKEESQSADDKQRCIRLHELTDEEKANRTFELPAPGFDGDFVIKYSSPNFVAVSDTFTVKGLHPSLEDDEWIKTVQKGITHSWLKKLKFTRNLDQVFQRLGDKFTKHDIPKLSIRKPCPWWSRECDKDLLLGFRIHGYGQNNKIYADPELCFQRKHKKYVEKAKTKREKEEAEDSWPATATLNKRSVKLVEAILKRTNEGKGSPSKPAAPTTIKEEWSRREIQDLQRCLMIYGTCPDDKAVPQWNQIGSIAKLKKTSAGISAFVSKFLDMCRRVVEEHSEENADEKKDKKAEKQKDDIDDIPPNTAKKLLKRVELMNNLYEYVFPALEDQKSKLKYIKTTGFGLPKWWKAPAHDEELLQGVKLYGFDFKKIFADDKLSFAKVTSSSDKKVVYPREGLCVQRLEAIAKLFEKLEKLGTPTKSNTLWNFTPKKGHIVLTSPPVTKIKKEKEEKEKKIRIVRAKQSKLKLVRKKKDEKEENNKEQKDTKKEPRVAKPKPRKVKRERKSHKQEKKKEKQTVTNKMEVDDLPEIVIMKKLKFDDIEDPDDDFVSDSDQPQIIIPLEEPSDSTPPKKRKLSPSKEQPKTKKLKLDLNQPATQ